MNDHQRESEKETRFQFGKNWQAFLSVLDEEEACRCGTIGLIVLEATHLKPPDPRKYLIFIISEASYYKN